MRNLISKLFFLYYVGCIVFSQEIPIEFFIYKSNKILIDAGKNWNLNTSFNPQRIIKSQFYSENLSKDDTLKIKVRSGINTKNQDVSFYNYLHATFKDNFYVFLYPRFVNNANAFSRFSGLERDIPRLGFNSGETDLSGLGYENRWFFIQYGRGRQGWGTGNDIQLAISENAVAYDHGIIGFNFGYLRTRYFHGWLESIDLNNRYITGKGIEWSNKKNFIFSLSELVIYSGYNRSIDLAYLNPVASHLEIELNNRQNLLGNGMANGVWQSSLDLLIKPRLRISANFIIDEFILDKVEKDDGKENGLGYSCRVAWTPIHQERLLTLYLSIIQIGSHTLKHENGYNNFVQRDNPLGSIYGNDFRQLKLGFNFFKPDDIIVHGEAGKIETGENSIVKSPYIGNLDHNKGPFPSGIVENIYYLESEYRKIMKKNIHLIVQFEWKGSQIKSLSFGSKIGFDIYFNYNKKIIL